MSSPRPDTRLLTAAPVTTDLGQISDEIHDALQRGGMEVPLTLAELDTGPAPRETRVRVTTATTPAAGHWAGRFEAEARRRAIDESQYERARTLGIVEGRGEFDKLAAGARAMGARCGVHDRDPLDDVINALARRQRRGPPGISVAMHEDHFHCVIGQDARGRGMLGPARDWDPGTTRASENRGGET